jgi:raffinose/stachyose/melibiose transport system substrate-binding protein
VNQAKWITLAVGAATALVLSACTGAPPDKPSAGGGAGGSNRITYLIAQPDTPEQLAAIKEDVAAFEKSSGVTVKLNVVPLDSLETVLQTQLRSGNGPDVFDYDPGPGSAGVLAKAGLLYDLTERYKSQNYAMYPWTTAKVTFDNKILGVPDQIEEVGLFYNKDLLSEYGLSAPTSLADLRTTAAQVKAHGVIPIAFGDKEGWEGGHVLSISLTSMVGAEAAQALVAGKADWSAPGPVAAIKVWQDFDASGFLPKSAEAIDYNNANALFFSGKAAMNPTGTWLVQNIVTTVKADVGFMTFPGPDGPGTPVGDIGAGHFMSATSQDPQAALKFLDWFASTEHGRWELSQSMIPAFPIDTAGLDIAPLFAGVIASTASFADSSTGVGGDIGINVSDAFNDAMVDGMQGLFAGTRTPQDVGNRLQAVMSKGSS